MDISEKNTYTWDVPRTAHTHQESWARLCALIGRGVWRRLTGQYGPVQDIAIQAVDHEIGTQYQWLGHASFAICISGVSILIDPIIGNASWFFPRLQQPVFEANYFKKIQYILITHNHQDHLDYTTIRFILAENPAVIFLVPQGDGARLRRWGARTVHEFSWWQQWVISHSKQEKAPVTITFVPASHWSGRGLFDRNISLWGGWYIESENTRLFHAGDTGYDTHFNAIYERCGSPDIAFLPIAPGSACAVHLDAEGALRAQMALRAKKMVPMHWGTFWFDYESPHYQRDYLIDKKLSSVQAVEPGIWHDIALPMYNAKPDQVELQL